MAAVALPVPWLGGGGGGSARIGVGELYSRVAVLHDSMTHQHMRHQIVHACTNYYVHVLLARITLASRWVMTMMNVQKYYA